MAELKTPNGLIVGLIPDKFLPKENVEKPKAEEPVVRKPTRGRRPKGKD